MENRHKKEYKNEMKKSMISEQAAGRGSLRVKSG